MKDKKTNCPNCGAPIEHYYNYKCPYCKTFLHNTDEEIKTLNNCELSHIDVDMEISPIAWEVLITIRAVSVPRLSWYEEGVKDIVISGNDIGKRVGYRIAIPIDEFRAIDDSNFIKRIINSLPPIFERYGNEIIDKIMEKRIEMEYRV